VKNTQSEVPMATTALAYREQLIEEINKTPTEHLPYLVQIIRIF